MGEWTPGPWIVQKVALTGGGFLTHVQAAYGKPSMDESQLCPVRQLGEGVKMEANARLIALAPEMTEALRPFAVAARKAVHAAMPDNSPVGMLGLTAADWRKARALVTKLEEAHAHS